MSAYGMLEVPCKGTPLSRCKGDTAQLSPRAHGIASCAFPTVSALSSHWRVCRGSTCMGMSGDLYFCCPVLPMALYVGMVGTEPCAGNNVVSRIIVC